MFDADDVVHAGTEFAQPIPDALEGRTHFLFERDAALVGGNGTPTWPATKIQQPACVSMRSASLSSERLGSAGV